LWSETAKLWRELKDVCVNVNLAEDYVFGYWEKSGFLVKLLVQIEPFDTRLNRPTSRSSLLRPSVTNERHVPYAM
jgi:hypothetical protein